MSHSQSPNHLMFDTLLLHPLFSRRFVSLCDCVSAVAVDVACQFVEGQGAEIDLVAGERVTVCLSVILPESHARLPLSQHCCHHLILTVSLCV